MTPRHDEPLRSHPALASVELDGEVVVYDERDHRIHQLDRIGSIIWPWLDGTATIEELAADLADAFDAPLEEVRADLAALVEELQDKQLLADEDEPPSSPPERARARNGDPTYLTDPPAP